MKVTLENKTHSFLDCTYYEYAFLIMNVLNILKLFLIETLVFIIKSPINVYRLYLVQIATILLEAI